MAEPYLTPLDPEGAIAYVIDHARGLADDDLTIQLQMCIERLRNTLRSITRQYDITANITDRFEGAQAAAIAQVLRERHG